MKEANLDDIKHITAELILDFINNEKSRRFVMKSYSEISEESNKMKFAEKESITNKFTSYNEVKKYSKIV